MPSLARTRSSKISITVDERVLRDVRQRVVREGGTLSGYINDALAEDLRRRKLAELVATYESEHGEISQEEIAAIRASMRK